MTRTCGTQGPTRAGDERGFTLIELLVTMTMTVVVFGTVLSVLGVFQSSASTIQLRNENQDTVRTTLDRLSRQLRDVVARTTSKGRIPGALEQAEPYGITFETVDTTTSSSEANKLDAMRVRYCLDDSNPEDEVLWEEVMRWKTAEPPAVPSSTACPDDSSTDWESRTQAVSHITNLIPPKERPLFTYSAQETPQILSVDVDMFLNLEPHQKRPGETELTTGISLRNANRTPIAEFIATEEGNGTVRLNASASYDPDGLSLKYRWWLNGQDLLTTAQQYVTKQAFAAGTTQTFKLEVTNPGGLFATTEKKLAIK